MGRTLGIPDNGFLDDMEHSVDSTEGCIASTSYLSVDYEPPTLHTVTNVLVKVIDDSVDRHFVLLTRTDL